MEFRNSACEPDLDFLEIARGGRGADSLCAKAAEFRQSFAFQRNSRLFAPLFPWRTYLKKSSTLSACWDVEKEFLGHFRQSFLSFGRRNCLAQARFCCWQALEWRWLCLIPALWI